MSAPFRLSNVYLPPTPLPKLIVLILAAAEHVEREDGKREPTGKRRREVGPRQDNELFFAPAYKVLFPSGEGDSACPRNPTISSRPISKQVPSGAHWTLPN